MRAPERDARRRRIIELLRRENTIQQIRAATGATYDCIRAIAATHALPVTVEPTLYDRATVAAMRRNTPRTPGGLIQATPCGLSRPLHTPRPPAPRDVVGVD